MAWYAIGTNGEKYQQPRISLEWRCEPFLAHEVCVKVEDLGGKYDAVNPPPFVILMSSRNEDDSAHAMASVIAMEMMRFSETGRGATSSSIYAVDPVTLGCTYPTEQMWFLEPRARNGIVEIRKDESVMIAIDKPDDATFVTLGWDGKTNKFQVSGETYGILEATDKENMPEDYAAVWKTMVAAALRDPERPPAVHVEFLQWLRRQSGE